MIDFHNHILPNLDDGSQSMEMTLNMLKKASDQGIKKIVNTIHFQHPKMEGKNTDYNYVNNVKEQVLEEADKNNLNIEIDLASEVYYLPNLCDLIENPIITINNYILIEFPMLITPSNFLDTFFNLKVMGINPILAHPERYRFVQQNVMYLDKLRDLEIIFQIDAGSLIGHFGKKTKDTAFSMLENGYCHIIGSDAHNDKKRNFCLKEAYDILSLYDSNIIEDLIYNSECIVENKNKPNSIKLKAPGFFKRIIKKYSS